MTQILMMPVSGQDENEDEPAKARQPTEASEVAKVCFFPGGFFPRFRDGFLGFPNDFFSSW